MPTDKKIINFAIDDDLLKRLEDFRFGNRINTMSETIRRLIIEALGKYDDNESYVDKPKEMNIEGRPKRVVKIDKK